MQSSAMALGADASELHPDRKRLASGVPSGWRMLSAKLLCASRADHGFGLLSSMCAHGSTHLWWRCVRLPAGQVLIPDCRSSFDGRLAAAQPKCLAHNGSCPFSAQTPLTFEPVQLGTLATTPNWSSGALRSRVTERTERLCSTCWIAY
jgi:hypothetical protein